MPRAERLAVLGLLVGMVVSSITLFVLSKDLSFWSDELDWLTFGDDFAPETLLTPHNSHLIGVVRVIYEGFPRLFDADYLPFRILSIAAVQACAALFFVLARRRVGGPMALAPALILLFFGSSSEVVISPLGLPISLSIAFGLGAFVALERETRGGDVAAIGLLALSILSDTFGTIIAGGVFLYLMLDPARRRRAWVALVPLLLYVAWWVWARKFDQDIAAASNLAGIPLFVLESAAATLGAITGVGKSFGSSSDALESAVTVVFSAIALAGTVLLVIRSRRIGAGATLWAFGLTLLAFWTAIALSESDVRTPSTPRYLLFAAIMVFLILAESYRGERFGRTARTWILVVLVACFAGNLARLVHNADGLADRAEEVKSNITMIELAGGEANPGFSPNAEGPPASTDIVASSAALNEFADTYGSLGYSLDEFRELPERTLEDGDFVLARALNLLSVTIDDETLLDSATDCEEVASPFELRPGLNVLRPPGDSSPQRIRVARFGAEPTVEIGDLEPGVPELLNLPDDATEEPWLATTDSPIEVCELVVAEG